MVYRRAVRLWEYNVLSVHISKVPKVHIYGVFSSLIYKFMNFKVIYFYQDEKNRI